MSFLAPLFLIGLAGLAVPVLLHLTRHERGKPVQFPSLMFLERIPFQETSRRRIQHWFLLSLRLLALGLLVAAFARPFVRAGRLAAVGGLGPEEVVILLDQSYSMGLDDTWSQASERARSAIASLGPLDRVSLIAFSQTPHLLHRSTTDHQRVAATVDTLTTGSLATRIAPAVRLASSTLAASTLDRHRVVLISDFQRTAFRADEEAGLPDGVLVETIDVGRGEAANLGLSDLALGRSATSGRDRLAVEARVVNTSKQVLTADAALLVDETQVQTRPVTVEAGSAARIAFDPFTLTQRFTRGQVVISDEGLQEDNALTFVVSPGGNVHVFIVDPAGVGESNLYLRQALGIAEGAGFEVTVVRNAPSESALEQASAVIFNGAPFPSGDGGTRLQAFMEGGGGVLVASGDGSRVPADQAPVFPVTLGEALDAGRDPLRLGFLDYDHAVFEVFRGARSGDFSRAGFYRTRALTLGAEGRALARFDDGSVALAESRVGRGRLLVWASGLDRLWSSLPLQPVYLPFVHQLVTYLGGDSEIPSWHEAGTTVDLVALAESAGGFELPDDVVAIAPSGGSLELDPADPLLRLDERGIWELRSPGSRPERPFALAVNVDLAESDLSGMDLEEFRGSIGAGAGYEGESGEGQVLEAQGEDFERRQSFWRYLIAAAFLLLAVETVLANWLSRHAIKQEATV